MLLKGKTGKVGPPNLADLPINKTFLDAVKISIEDHNREHKKKIPSAYYSPSSMNCIRQMYYKRTSTIPDEDETLYSDVGMADTGTRRHEAIQEALLYMTKKHSTDFIYVDVAEYVKQKQARGKCLNLVILGKAGAETMLLDKELGINFRCDGILLHLPSKKFYLFEFKNQISFKASGKESVDLAHHNQVIMYCTLLDLDSALVLYENRDNCELYCPEVFNVSEYDKAMAVKQITDCNDYVKHHKTPPIPENISAKDCGYCRYRITCRKDGRDCG